MLRTGIGGRLGWAASLPGRLNAAAAPGCTQMQRDNGFRSRRQTTERRLRPNKIAIVHRAPFLTRSLGTIVHLESFEIVRFPKQNLLNITVPDKAKHH